MTGFQKIRYSLTISLALGLVVSACQTSGIKSVSLDEAKKITAEFQGSSYTPPRSTADVMALLKASVQDETASARSKSKSARALLMEKPAPGLSGDALMVFHRDRANAAKQLGNAKLEITEIERAAAVMEGQFGLRAAKLQYSIAMARLRGGSTSQAIQHLSRAIAELPETHKGLSLVWHSLLARMYTNIGSLVAARAALQQAQSLLDDAYTYKNWDRAGASWTFATRKAEAFLLSWEGKPGKAEGLYRLALRDVLQGRTFKGWDRAEPATRGDLARVLLWQGKLAEAEVEARQALFLIIRRFGRHSTDTALLVRYLALIVGNQGRFREAEDLLRTSIDIHNQVGVREGNMAKGWTRFHLAKMLMNQDRWSDAIEQFTLIKKELAASPRIFQRRFGTRPDRSLSLLKSGRVDEALSQARRSAEIKQSSLGPKHYDTAYAQSVLAMAEAAKGNRAAALAGFAAALPVLLSRSRQSVGSEGETQASKAVRQRLILEAYIKLLAAGGSGDAKAVAETFRLADTVRGRTVMRAVAASGARSAIKDPAGADLVRREQDAQKQISALYHALSSALSLPKGQRNASSIADLRARIDDLRGARAALMEEIEGTNPEYAQLINPKAGTVDAVQARLGADEALVSFYVGEDASYVWAVPKSGAVSFAVARLGRKDLATRVTSLRRALDPEAEVLGDIPDFDVAGAYELYASLLKPVEKGWKGAKHLIVVAHGPLGQLPLSVLVTERTKLPAERAPLFSKYRSAPWLARSHAVSYAPSVSSFLTLRRLPGGDGTRLAFAGFGDPVFAGAETEATPKPAQVASRGRLSVRSLRLSRRSAPATRSVNSADLAALPRLPDTAAEVKSIAVALNADPTRDVFTGARASEDLVKSTDLSNRRVLAFATHGLVPGDLNGLTQPALALSSPKASGGQEDGLLTMGEILGLRLDADWVILSACNTASADGAGAEAVSGLGRAFFYAGARALLVSHWPVETTSARALTTSIFARQAKDAALSRAAALQQSMLSLIDGPGRVDAQTGKTLYSYAHPLFWAPFTLIGEGQQKQAGS